MGKHLMIEGRVQGVYYRASFAALAGELGVRGWVRNRHDGAVEAVIHGEDAQLAALIAWSRQGPPAAVVSQVSVSDSDEAAPAAFDIRPTA